MDIYGSDLNLLARVRRELHREIEREERTIKEQSAEASVSLHQHVRRRDRLLRDARELGLLRDKLMLLNSRRTE